MPSARSRHVRSILRRGDPASRALEWTCFWVIVACGDRDGAKLAKVMTQPRAFQAAALHLLPPALTALRHRHPDAELSIVDTTSDRGGDEVAAGRLDMAVVASWGIPMAAPAHVTVHPLLRDPLVVVLPDDHRLVRRHPTAKTVRLEQLRDEAWVTILAGHAARAQFDDAAVAAGFTPKIRFQTESYDVAQALVGTGIGVALVSRLALRRVPGTTHRSLARPRLHREIFAVTPADTTFTPLVATFLELLYNVSRDIATSPTVQ
jgi:DNA-binding transcriptional LysR family regulator